MTEAPEPSPPAPWVKRGLELARGQTLYGRMLEQMSRDELLAAAALGWAEAGEQMDRRHKISMRFLEVDPLAALRAEAL